MMMNAEGLFETSVTYPVFRAFITEDRYFLVDLISSCTPLAIMYSVLFRRRIEGLFN